MKDISKKYRICIRSNKYIDSWYVIQIKILFHWHTYNICFTSLDKANAYLKHMIDRDSATTFDEDVLVFKDGRYRQTKYSEYNIVKINCFKWI